MAARARICEQLASCRDGHRITEGGVLAFLTLLLVVLRKQGHNGQQCGKPAHIVKIPIVRYPQASVE
jgi:hypothetical protein